MKIFDDVLPPEFIFKIKHDNLNLKDKNVWRSNLSWPNAIVKSSSLVLIRSLGDEETQHLRNRLLELKAMPNNPDLQVGAMVYLWSPLSHIPWHNDEKWKGAATIYLNENWDPDWGGYLMWQENNEIKAVIPQYNRLAVNSGKIPHATTLTTKDAELRETIQIFWF